jgi:hypothetical protein
MISTLDGIVTDLNKVLEKTDSASSLNLLPDSNLTSQRD